MPICPSPVNDHLSVRSWAALIRSVAILLGGLLALPVEAGQGTATALPHISADSFKDLPGVRPLDPERQFGPSQTCDTRIVSDNRPGSNSLRDSMPYRIYRCERDGIVYEGTEPPRSGDMWYPGVNPRVID